VGFYNAQMLTPIANSLSELVLPAATARFVLLANHVLSTAPVATQRLKAHAGRSLRVEVEGWRGPLPPPPPLTLLITPAGLFEAVECPAGDVAATSPAADLCLRVDASQPLEAARRMVAGEMPPLQIEGDVALAADVNWVVANVRWDIAADLERVFGLSVADGLVRAGDQALSVARQVARQVQEAASLLRRS